VNVDGVIKVGRQRIGISGNGKAEVRIEGQVTWIFIYQSACPGHIRGLSSQFSDIVIL
jgi:hypothetical protein